MKILYMARSCRFDLLYPVCSFAREVTKWNKASDKKLHRLVSYMNTTKDVSLETFVGDNPEQCKIMLFSDADFAGDLQTSKSTSGAFIAIVGDHTFAPINAICKRQSVVSHSR